MGPTVKRTWLLPVLESLAEALMPGQPDKAASARSEGQQDMAKLYATSGKHSPEQIRKAWLLRHCTSITQQYQQQHSRLHLAGLVEDGETSHCRVPEGALLVRLAFLPHTMGLTKMYSACMLAASTHFPVHP